jgi:hypothetical protein
MKTGWRLIILGVALVLVASAGAQQVQLVSAKTELSKGLDAKKLKQGDPVSAKVTEDVKFSTGSTLPRGSLILGHVDKVQPSENKGVSSIVLTFDKAQSKGGQPIAVKAVVMGVYPPISQMSNAATTGITPSQPTHPSDGVTEQKDAMPGVDMHSDLHETTSITLTSQTKNVHLPDGTQWAFAIAPLPEGSDSK